MTTISLPRLTVISIALALALTAVFGLMVNPSYADTNKKVVLENATIRIERIMQLSGTEAARAANPQWFTHTCSEGQKLVNQTIDKAVAEYPSLERKLVTLLTKEPTTYSAKDGGCSWGRWTTRTASADGGKKVVKKTKLVAIVRVQP